MGTVVPLRHERSSPETSTPKIDGEARKFRWDKTFENAGKSLGGMRLRSFQFHTAGPETPANSAAAASPPIASMTCSTDVSMRLISSQPVKLSSLHQRKIASGAHVAENKGMDEWGKIAERLLAFQEGAGKSGAEICRSIGAPENSWIQWTSAKYGRIIPPEFASRLCLNYELTLDWIYRGLPVARIPDHIRDGILNKVETKGRKPARK